MGPTGIFTLGSALFNQRPSTEARISVLPPRLPFAAVTPPGTDKFGVGIFFEFHVDSNGL